MKYYEFTTVDIYAFKTAILRLEKKPAARNAKILFTITETINSYPSSPFIVVFTDSRPGDPTSVSEVLSVINVSKTRVRNFNLYCYRFKIPSKLICLSISIFNAVIGIGITKIQIVRIIPIY